MKKLKPSERGTHAESELEPGAPQVRVFMALNTRWRANSTFRFRVWAPVEGGGDQLQSDPLLL